MGRRFEAQSGEYPVTEDVSERLDVALTGSDQALVKGIGEPRMEGLRSIRAGWRSIS